MSRTAVLIGNPASFNDAGREAREAMAEARKTVARFLNARPDEMVFTGSGSEANNLAIHGTAKNFLGKIKPHIITTHIEHPSVLEPLKELEKRNFRVTYLPVNKEGFVDLNELRDSLRQETVLISVMYANNEIGTVEPVKQIGKIIKEFNRQLEIENWKFKTGGKRRVFFHVDACQAAGFLDMDVQRLGADLLTFNGSKLGGPRGIGVLYVRRGTPIRPLILGGGQERGLRAGTENIPAIIGLAEAVSLVKPGRFGKMAILRDYGTERILKEIPEVRLNGPTGDDRLPNNINICLPDLSSEILLLELDKHDIAAGSGSACTSHAVEPSHVLKAIGVPKHYIDGALRFSLGRDTTKSDIDYLVRTLKKIIPDLRKRYNLVK